MLELNSGLYRHPENCDVPSRLEILEKRTINGVEHVYTGNLIFSQIKYPVREGILQIGAHQNEALYNKMWKTDDNAVSEAPGVSGREKLLFLLGKKTLGFLENKAFVDIGAGLGYRTQSAVEMGATVVALDSSFEGLKRGRDRMARQLTPEQFARVDFVQADILQNVFQPGSFDVVFSSYALHHTVDTHRAILNIGKYVSCGGYLAVTVFVPEDNFPNTVWVCRSEVMSLPRDVRQRAMAKAGLLPDKGTEIIVDIPEIVKKVEADPDLARIAKSIGLLYLVHRENLDTEYMWIQSQREVASWICETGCFIEFQYGETTVGRRKAGGIIDKVRCNARLRNMILTVLDRMRSAIQ
ncbi:MAG: class I SAM-dependent methyltransferase [Syntrophales bacterium]